jgi:hypothetical protein
MPGGRFLPTNPGVVRRSPRPPNRRGEGLPLRIQNYHCSILGWQQMCVVSASKREYLVCGRTLLRRIKMVLMANYDLLGVKLSTEKWGETE